MLVAFHCFLLKLQLRNIFLNWVRLNYVFRELFYSPPTTPNSTYGQDSISAVHDTNLVDGRVRQRFDQKRHKTDNERIHQKKKTTKQQNKKLKFK